MDAASPTPRKLRRRRLLWVLLALPLAPRVLLAGTLLRMWPDPTPGYGKRRGTVAHVECTATERGAFVREDLRIVSTSGLTVELALLRPRAPGPYPLLLLLVGQNTGKEAVDLFEDLSGTVVEALDYAVGETRKLCLIEGLRKIPAFQDALRDTPPAVMLALDVLLADPAVGANHVELVGGSRPYALQRRALIRSFPRSSVAARARERCQGGKRPWAWITRKDGRAGADPRARP